MCSLPFLHALHSNIKFKMLVNYMCKTSDCQLAEEIKQCLNWLLKWIIFTFQIFHPSMQTKTGSLRHYTTSRVIQYIKHVQRPQLLSHPNRRKQPYNKSHTAEQHPDALICQTQPSKKQPNITNQAEHWRI